MVGVGGCVGDVVGQGLDFGVEVMHELPQPRLGSCARWPFSRETAATPWVSIGSGHSNAGHSTPAGTA